MLTLPCQSRSLRPCGHSAFTRPVVSSIRPTPHSRSSPCQCSPVGEPQTPAVSSPSTPAPSGSLLSSALRDPPEWAGFVGTLFSSGATTGTLLDGIHSRVGLQVYDALPVVLGGVHTSILVPPLLGTFYVVLGLLVAAADNLAQPDTATAQAIESAQDVTRVALAFGLLAGGLQLSASLYEGGAPFWQIHLALAAVTAVTWAASDGTRQGLALALLCATVAPAAEVIFLSWGWHYPRADILGGAFVSWVPWCYAFYVPAIASLSRFLWKSNR